MWKALETSPGWLPALKPTVASGLTDTLWMAPLKSSAMRGLGSFVLTCLLKLKAKRKMGPPEDLWAKPCLLAGSILPGNAKFWEGLSQPQT